MDNHFFFAAENELDLNSIGFLKESTLKSWVAEKFHDLETLVKLQKMLFRQIYGAPGYREYNYAEIESEEVNKYPGKTCPILPDLYLPYLQAVHEAGKKRSLSIIEIGVAWGLKFWPLSWALSHPSILYANDLSTAVGFRFDKQIKECFSHSTQIAVEKLFGINCHTLTNYPSLKEKMDFLLSENVCQFFNPGQHQEFLCLLDYLLKPFGKAFISGAALNCKMTTMLDPLFLAYSTAKNNKAIYPGFLRTRFRTTENDKYDIIASKTPPVDTQCASWYVEGSKLPLLVKEDDSYRVVFMVEKIDIINYMTPEVFKDSVLFANKTKKTNLTVNSAFFLNYKGERCEEFVPEQGINLAAAIIQKN